MTKTLARFTVTFFTFPRGDHAPTLRTLYICPSVLPIRHPHNPDSLSTIHCLHFMYPNSYTHHSIFSSSVQSSMLAMCSLRFTYTHSIFPDTVPLRLVHATRNSFMHLSISLASFQLRTKTRSSTLMCMFCLFCTSQAIIQASMFERSPIFSADSKQVSSWDAHRD